MKKLLFIFILATILLGACSPKQPEYTINGHIRSGAAKYLKIIDMTRPGLAPDSIELDLGGKFTFTKTSTQPGDYILYFKQAEYIRITPLPNEIITLKGDYNNLAQTGEVSGSHESQQVIAIIRNHQKAVHIIDTLNRFYMNNQLSPNLEMLIMNIKHISDSVYQAEKTYLETFISNNPASMAGYIALSLKLGQNTPLFTLQNDLPYFEMVDSSLYVRFDTVDIVKMMHAFVLHGKARLKQNTDSNTGSLKGKEAPPAALPNIKNDTLQLSELKGKYVLVDFWGSWCRPCRKENANLVSAYQKYNKKGFEIFQIALERNITDWKNSIREDKLNWKYQVVDLKYMNSEIARAYQIKAIPANYLVNPEGVIVAHNLYGEQLNIRLEEIFGSKPKPTVQNVQ